MISIALQKDSEFAELFDHHLIKMQEKGILDRIRHEWTDGKDQDYSIFQAGSLDIQQQTLLLHHPPTTHRRWCFSALSSITNKIGGGIVH